MLSDEFVDIVGGSFDVAIRIADLQDSSLVARRLAANHRVLCAAPSYIAAHGMPRTLQDLSAHRLIAHNADHWRLEGRRAPRPCGSTGSCGRIPAKWCARR